MHSLFLRPSWLIRNAEASRKSLLVDAQVVTSEAPFASLHKSCLVLQSCQSLLQALDFCFTPSFSGLVGLRLGNASVLDLGIVIQNCAQFGVCRLTIGR